MEKITPKVDIAFKKIFGVEENKDLLISLINAIVSPADQLTEVTLLNPYNPRNFKNEKLSILDIKAKNKSGKRYNIEIQVSDEADYDKRALFYWGKMYTEQIGKGLIYSGLSKAIGIHILNFESIPESTKYHNVFHLAEDDYGSLPYFKDLELHTIELTKFSKTTSSDRQFQENLKKVKNKLDMWLTFLNNNELLDRNNLPQQLNDAKLKKALDVLDVMNFSKDEREAYENHLKWLRVEANTLKKCEEQALKKGREEGREEGLEQGKNERNIEIAKSMLQEGFDKNTISKVTGLPVATIQKLPSH